jgi:hypothetical protein
MCVLISFYDGTTEQNRREIKKGRNYLFFNGTDGK